jgi:hypothetical protein
MIGKNGKISIRAETINMQDYQESSIIFANCALFHGDNFRILTRFLIVSILRITHDKASATFSSHLLIRYHHRWGEPARDPTFMDESSARIVARAARLRYELLPYIYTHLQKATTTGMPFVRPLAIEYPDDNSTWTLDEQFMVTSHYIYS